MALALALVILAFAAGFHLHWALGGRRGFAVSLPQRPDGVPVMAHRLPWWRPAAAGVAVALCLLGALLLAKAGLVRLPVPDEWLQACLVAAGIALVGRAVVPNRWVGFFKSIRGTRWAIYDTRLYSPLILLLGLLILLQALA